jgi:DNA-binding NarL/FixJ family response regulator
MDAIRADSDPASEANPNNPNDPPLPLTADEWEEVIRRLRLTRQQTRIVEQLLGGLHDKQIASALRLSIPTVRTHLRRLSANIGVSDRVELVLRIFRIVCELRMPQDRSNHK